MTHHITLERLLEFLRPAGAEFSAQEVQHLADCDDCSGLTAEAFKMYTECV
jgi:hypothetical protein